MSPERVVVVGASVAGVAAADALRTRGHGGQVTLVDADPSLPYDKPPLSKAALKQDWSTSRGLLRPESHYRDQRIDLELGRRAAGVDLDARSLLLDDGRTLGWDALVLATGVRARPLPPAVAASGLRAVHAIRTAEDSAAVREALPRARRVVIVGGGFIGVEAAAIAAETGCEVTIVDRLSLPFSDVFGADVARHLAARHAAHGVTLVGGAGVSAVRGAASVEDVVLDDGRTLAADLVLVGIGAVPNVEWLHGSGLDVTGGIRCDAHGRTDRAGVWAAGDVAAWWHPTTRQHVRLEHWTTAKEQGSAVGHNIADPGAPPRSVGEVPYFWSDQYGRRLQFLGTVAGHDRVEVLLDDWREGPGLALYSRAGRVVGALGLGATRDLMRLRPAIAAGASIDELLSAAGAP